MTTAEQNVVRDLVAFSRHDPACALYPFKWWWQEKKPEASLPPCICGLDTVLKRVDELVSE